MLPHGAERPPLPWGPSPLNISLVYVVTAIAWILVSDRILRPYAQSLGTTHLFTLKGIAFVLLTGFLLHWLVTRLQRRLHASASEACQAESLAQRSAHGLRQLLEMLPEAVLIVREGRVVYANQAAVELFDPQGSGALQSCPLLELFCPQYRPGVDQRVRRMLESGQRDSRFLPRIMLRLDGSRFEASVGTSAVHLDEQPAVLKIVRNVDEMKRAQREVLHAREELAALSGRLITLQEQERRAIARELHDEIGQCLSAIRVQFAKLQRRVQDEEPLALIASASSLTESTLGRVRSLSLLLHPPQLETLGLEAALRWHIEEQQRLHGTAISFDVRPPMQAPVHPDLAIAAYRIVQESLSNALRHARARRITVEMRGDDPDALLLHIADDGVGFAAQRRHERFAARPTLGLTGMMERARLRGGEVKVSSAPGEGTRILAQLPWKIDTKTP